MLKQLTFLTAILLLCLTPLPGRAQSPPTTPEKSYYRLDFTIREVDSGKTVSSHVYSALAATHQKTEVRAGTKLPYRSENNVLNYMDLGVSIDCLDLTEVGNEVSLRVVADISSAADPQNKAETPVLRQNKWDSSTIVPLNQTVTLFSSDDLGSKSKLQLQVMVSPVK